MSFGESYLYGDGHNNIITNLIKFVREANVQCIAVSGLSGIAIGGIVANDLKIPLICVRKKGETSVAYKNPVKLLHFTDALLFGYRHNLDYLIIDDTIDSGGTVKHIIQGINDEVCSGLRYASLTCKGVVLYASNGCCTKDDSRVQLPVYNTEHFEDKPHKCKALD